VELSVRLVTRPRPGTRARVLVLVIVAVLMVVWGSGYEPVTAISLILGAGFAGTQVARALIAGGAAVPSPDSEAGPPSLS
jgi:hypothetical protein